MPKIPRLCSLFSLLLLLLALVIPVLADGPGMDNLRKAFKSPPREFTQIPFWFWNDEVTEEGIRAQIARMEEKGVYGFTIHARLGLSSSIPYMGDRWLQLVRTAVEEAAKRQMQVYLYDEAMYPSGSAHGRVVATDRKLASQGLRMVARHFSGPRQVAVDWTLGENEERVAAVIVQKDPASGKYLRGTAKPVADSALSGIDVPEGDWTVFMFAQTPSGGRIRGVHDGEEDNQAGAPASADLLNPAATARFIAETHEKYYGALSAHFGPTIRAIFTDEPNILGRRSKPGLVPWTWNFFPRLNSQVGRDFTTSLPFLWVEASDRGETGVRSEFNTAVAASLNESYYKPLSDWCAAHSVALTGHPAGSGEMAPLFHFQIPGQDVVWRYVVPGGTSALEGNDSTIGKSGTSVAVNLQRPIVINELYGAYGWQLTMDEMKWLADWLFVRGTNTLMPHAFYYSVRGERLNERPPDVGWNNNWWDHYEQLTAYTNRLSWLLRGGTPVAPVAVLATADSTPWRAARVLFQNQKDFFYLPDSLLSEARVEGGQLKIGAASYSVLLIDGIESPSPSLLTALLAVMDKGVPVIAYDSRFRASGSEPAASDLLSRVTRHSRFAALRADERRLIDQVNSAVPQDIVVRPASVDLRYCHREREGIHFYLMVNEGEQSIRTDVAFSQKTAPEIWDAETGATLAAPRAVMIAGQVHLPVKLESHQSMVLVFDPSGPPPLGSEPVTMPLRTEIPVTFLGWELQLGTSALRMTQLGTWTEFADARSFSGTGWYSHSIQCPVNAGSGRVFLECGKIEGFAEAKVNGKSAGIRLWAPFRFDVTGMIKPGPNAIEIGVTNTRANEILPQKVDAGLLGPVRLVIER